MKKYIFALNLMLFLFAIPIFSQNSRNAEPSSQNATENSFSDFENLSIDEYLQGTQNPQNSLAQTPPEIERPPSSFFLFFRMILVLALVVGCVYIAVYFLKKLNHLPSDDEQFLRKVSQITLSPGKSAQIITLLDKAYIVGVAENSVNLIAEINDKELVDSMNLYADKKSAQKKPRSFSEVLEIFMPSEKKSNLFSGEKDLIQKNLAKHREKLNDDE